MIKLNLLEQKKPFKLPLILGMDLSHISVKGMIFVYILLQIPDFSIKSIWQEEIDKGEKEILELNKKKTKLKLELRSHADTKKMLDDFNKQIKRLELRQVQVDKIVQKRSNPKKLLERIARNIPEDLWFTKVEVKPGKKIELKGMSTNYRSIGEFISSANDSAYFGKSLTLSGSKTQEHVFDSLKKRVEVFKVEGSIKVFDPSGAKL